MDSPNTCRVVTAGSVSKGLLTDIGNGIRGLDRAPKLVGFLANSDPGARTYAEWTSKTCVKNGIHFELREVDKDMLVESISHANLDESVDGIMVYYPVYNNLKDQQIKKSILPGKDVEGLNSSFMLHLYQHVPWKPAYDQQPILPTTPLSMIEILNYLGIYKPATPGNRLLGRQITIINRSDVVGKPLAALIAYEGASVYSVDITGIQIFQRSQAAGKGLQISEIDMTLEDCLSISDVVISGVPGDSFKIPIESLKDGCVCLNFSSEKNFDQSVKSKASIFVPSIGQVTIAVLMRNLLYLIKNKELRYKQALDQKHHDHHRHWILRYLGIKSLLSSQSWDKKLPWIEYAICLVGVSVGIFSLFQ